jgi:hypothetical protein
MPSEGEFSSRCDDTFMKKLMLLVMSRLLKLFVMVREPVQNYPDMHA